MRTSHDKKTIKGIDIMKPILATDLGTKNDPCFGKLYSVMAQECRRCGDADICAILCQDQIHKEITGQKGAFLDVEEANLIDEQNEQIGKLILNTAKKDPKTWLSFSKLVPRVIKRFNLTGKDDLQALQRIIKAAKDNPTKIEINKSLTKYKLK